MTPTHQRAIAWFRRDLRLGDNRMLAQATAQAGEVFPVFVADPEILGRNAGATGRLAWFAASVTALDDRLRDEGSGLAVLAGRPEEVLRDFATRVGASAVFAGRDEEPDARARDEAVARVLPLRLVEDQRLLPADRLRTGSDEAYRVFTPFRRALDEQLARAATELTAEEVPDLSRLAAPLERTPGPDAFPAGPAPYRLPPAGEAAARERLATFARQDLRRYAAERDRADLDCTSRISPYLRSGSLSIREAWRAALAAERDAADRGDDLGAAGARRWRDELAWREFYAAILLAHPRVASGAFRAEYAELAWEGGSWAEAALDAWRQGRTGYPIVDAGMRQLVATGSMHNRLRLITASFLVKDLGIDWRRGEAVFMEHLLDGDLAQNNGNWQWVAGVGTDAAPYFRVFNPVLQGKRFDPDGAFVRRWLPELEGVPDACVHEPWRAPRARRPGDYPEPIVDHAAARRRTLARYAATS